MAVPRQLTSEERIWVNGEFVTTNGAIARMIRYWSFFTARTNVYGTKKRFRTGSILDKKEQVDRSP